MNLGELKCVVREVNGVVRVIAIDSELDVLRVHVEVCEPYPDPIMMFELNKQANRVKTVECPPIKFVVYIKIARL